MAELGSVIEAAWERRGTFPIPQSAKRFGHLHGQVDGVSLAIPPHRRSAAAIDTNDELPLP